MEFRLILEKQLDFNSHAVRGDPDNLPCCHHHFLGVRKFEGHGDLMSDGKFAAGLKKNTRGADVLNRCRE